MTLGKISHLRFYIENLEEKPFTDQVGADAYANYAVEAARAVGCSTTRVLARHILPNTMAPAYPIYQLYQGT